MKFKYILFSCFWFNLVFVNFGFCQISISGSFWDDNTGIDLKSSVFGIKGGEKIKITETGKNQTFNFELETDIDTLHFVSDGYSTVIVPVNFEGEFSKLSFANLSINSKGGSGQKHHKNLLIFCIPSTPIKGMQYELFNVKKDSLFENTNFTILINNLVSYNKDIYESHLVKKIKVIVSTFDDSILIEKDLKANQGFTFVDLNAYPKENKPKLEENITDIFKEATAQNIESERIATNNLPYSLFGFRSLFFDQSKFELKSENKLVLDSLAIYLNHKTNARISVAGFTDNVGDQSLNVTLARYRAQVVNNYLHSKGVNFSQMEINWLSKNKQADQNLDDINKLRKVEITEIK